MTRPVTEHDTIEPMSRAVWLVWALRIVATLFVAMNIIGRITGFSSGIMITDAMVAVLLANVEELRCHVTKRQRVKT
ncbi:MAG: hypothetical protein A3E78_15475 [Alphaproteobacteria bacterium RIFCSPHIGHO2_12_FULL_63_12]|nr:MAG: hypothetical protein A3E78_15475 [Alphaproteobacteria bacterium RIFCSPHIGHO2_12_FULL_63_12]